MLRVTTKLTEPALATATLCLPFELRQRSRLRARLEDGRDVGLFLMRGSVLRDGDCLRAEDDTVIAVRAALQRVSTAYAETPLVLARACYHLGNRHVPLQIGLNWVRYECDHVLDEMVLGLGLAVACELAPFEPESGAYDGVRHVHPVRDWLRDALRA